MYEGLGIGMNYEDSGQREIWRAHSGKNALMKKIKSK